MVQFLSKYIGQIVSGASNRKGPNGARQHIYDLLRAQVRDGTLPVGSRVPSTRTLAAEHSVSRTTVTSAFEQLIAEGYLETAAGQVARVAGSPAFQVTKGAALKGSRPPSLSNYAQRVMATHPPGSPGDPPPIDFLYGAVELRSFPLTAWRRAYVAELVRHQPHLNYALPEGDLHFRQTLHAYLRRARGLTCDADQIVVVHGATQALDLCARLLLDPGDAFAMEEPGYVTAKRSFEATGARRLSVPVDANGLVTTKLPEGHNARLVYVTPSHQFPLGGVLPIGRRLELLAWAKRQDAWIIEDDYDGEFRYGQRPIDALQSMDSEGRVIYVGTFSKALSPQLRLGYLVLPRQLVSAFRQAKRLTDHHAPVLEQRTLAALIESGAYERHVRRVRRDYDRKRRTLIASVAQYLPADAQIGGDAAGLHVVLWLPSFQPEDERRIASAARHRGVGVYPVSPLFADALNHFHPRPAGLILGYASLSVEQIQNGIRILASTLAAVNANLV